MAKKSEKLKAPQKTEVLEPVTPVPDYLKKEVTAELPDDIDSCIALASRCYYNVQIQRTLYGWFIGRIAEHIDAKHGEKDKADKELCETIGTEMRYLKYMKAIYRTFPDYDYLEKMILHHSLGTSALREISRLEESGVKKVVKELEDGTLTASLEKIRDRVESELGTGQDKKISEKSGEEEKPSKSKVDQESENAPASLNTDEPEEPEGTGSHFLNQYRNIISHIRKEKLVDLGDVQEVVNRIPDMEGSEKIAAEESRDLLLDEVDDLVKDLDDLGEMLHSSAGGGSGDS